MTGALLCGADLGDGYTCAVPAGQDHNHDDAAIAKGVDQIITQDMQAAYAVDEAERAETEALLNQADLMVPARGLAESLAGGAVASKAPRVDFRAMLGDDSRAWTTRSRLAAVLGRQYLATTLVDQLDPETSATLADRLETLVSQAVSETEMKINQEVATATHTTIMRIRADADEVRSNLRKAVHSERFTGHSRLS